MLVIEYPECQLIVRVEFGRRNRFLGRLQHERFDTAPLVVDKRQAKKAELDDGAEFAGKAPHQGVTVVVAAERLRHSRKRLIARDE